MKEHASASVLDSKAIVFIPGPKIVVMYHP